MIIISTSFEGNRQFIVYDLVTRYGPQSVKLVTHDDSKDRRFEVQTIETKNSGTFVNLLKTFQVSGRGCSQPFARSSCNFKWLKSASAKFRVNVPVNIISFEIRTIVFNSSQWPSWTLSCFRLPWNFKIENKTSHQFDERRRSDCCQFRCFRSESLSLFDRSIYPWSRLSNRKFISPGVD